MDNSNSLPLYKEGPICPVPERIVHSHWASHLPFAYWIIAKMRPRLLVELGAYHGASFCAFCQQIDRLGLACEAYAIDSWQGDANMGSYGEEVYEDLYKYVHAKYPGFASLIRASFDEARNQFENGSIDLLHIDGFHSTAAMLHDFESWLPKLSDQGIILMHDINARLPGYGGVSAWREISARYPTFAFTHGYGLGLVAPGSNPPAFFKELSQFSLEESEQARLAFQAQGKLYERLFLLQEERQTDLANADSRLKQAQTDLNDAHKREANLLQDMAKARDENFTAITKLQFALEEERHQSTLKAQAYESSLSWKITAPLRKLARYFKN